MKNPKSCPSPPISPPPDPPKTHWVIASVKRTRDNPADVADQLDLQLYGMLNDDPAPELAEVTLLTNDDREIVSALVDGISNFRSAIRQDSTMLQAKKIQPLLEMADRLRSQADLTVSTVVLCRRVRWLRQIRTP